MGSWSCLTWFIWGGFIWGVCFGQVDGHGERLVVLLDIDRFTNIANPESNLYMLSTPSTEQVTTTHLQINFLLDVDILSLVPLFTEDALSMNNTVVLAVIFIFQQHTSENMSGTTTLREWRNNNDNQQTTILWTHCSRLLLQLPRSKKMLNYYCWHYLDSNAWKNSADSFSLFLIVVVHLDSDTTFNTTYDFPHKTKQQRHLHLPS